MTTEVGTNGATTLFRLNLCEYVEQVTMIAHYCMLFNSMVRVRIRVRIRFSVVGLVVMHTYFYYFRLCGTLPIRSHIAPHVFNVMQKNSRTACVDSNRC